MTYMATQEFLLLSKSFVDLPHGWGRIAWKWRKDHWQRMMAIVYWMAQDGISTGVELRKRAGIGPNAMGKIFTSLQVGIPDPLVEVQTVRLGLLALTIVNLTELGKRLGKALRNDVDPVESDWEKLARLHKADEQVKHAALVLFAAYQARLRGWKAEVVPFNPEETPWFQPDLKVTAPDGTSYYVEVETHVWARPEKWATKRSVNLVVQYPIQRKKMVQNFRDAGISGHATDLKTLAKAAASNDLSSFWLDTWH